MQCIKHVLYAYSNFDNQFVFIKAGIPELQILLALEPETAALFCRIIPERMLTPLGKFDPGCKYMVLDLGGIKRFLITKT